jgi:peptidyl-dipeptidase Dcp
MKLFRDFAGHEPKIEPLLERRGLTAPGADDSKAPDASPADPKSPARTGT